MLLDFAIFKLDFDPYWLPIFKAVLELEHLGYPVLTLIST
jgi:hypothetical protein